MVLYNWDGVGWCSGVIKEATGDKSKKVDRAVVNFKIYYEVDDDLSSHVLELDEYLPGGPPSSWVLLEATAALSNPSPSPSPSPNPNSNPNS